jgi:hypothetical protein
MLWRIYVPLFPEFQTDLLLRLSVSRLPIQIKDLTNGTQIVFGVAVAVQTPSHREWFFLVNDIHVIHVTVATRTADPPIDVHGMIEIGKIRYLMDLYPIDRISARPALSYRGQFRIVGFNLRMTIHAGLGGRNI